MNTLNLLLDDELWTDACREAALRAVDVDGLLADVLSSHFARWMTPDDAIDVRDPDLRVRLALAARQAVDREAGERLGRSEASDVRHEETTGGTPSAADATERWIGALAAAIADDVQTRIERLEEWQAVFRAGERAALRGVHGEAAARFREAAGLAGSARIPLAMTLERLARAELVLGHVAQAAEAARRAMVLAGQAGLAQAAPLARLVAVVETVAGGHRAVQQIVAGLVALDQNDPGTAAQRLADGAEAAAKDGRKAFEMRARGALAVVRLSAGAGRAASVEARRAAALAREAAQDDLGGLLDVLATAGELRDGPEPSPGRYEQTGGAAQSASQGSSSSGH